MNLFFPSAPGGRYRLADGRDGLAQVNEENCRHHRNPDLHHERGHFGHRDKLCNRTHTYYYLTGFFSGTGFASQLEAEVSRYCNACNAAGNECNNGCIQFDLRNELIHC
jgi:hypothetical protein